MEKTKINLFADGSRTAGKFGLRPLGARAIAVPQEADRGEMRRAAFTLVLALYPLVGSATIVLAAIMLASGANAR